MKSTISGTTPPVLALIMEPGEKVASKSALFRAMSFNVRVSTDAKCPGLQGFFRAIERVLTFEPATRIFESSNDNRATVVFTARAQGLIVDLDLDETEAYIIPRDCLIAATENVKMSSDIPNLDETRPLIRSGIRLQRVFGAGHAWIELRGNAIAQDIGAGQSINVLPLTIGALQNSVTFSVMRRSASENAIVRLTGPGRVWLQAAATEPGLSLDEEPNLVLPDIGDFVAHVEN